MFCNMLPKWHVNDIYSLHSSTSEQEDEQDDQQKLIQHEQVHSKKTPTSQLVQEEKAETGSVRDKMQYYEHKNLLRIKKLLWLPQNIFRG